MTGLCTLRWLVSDYVLYVLCFKLRGRATTLAEMAPLTKLFESQVTTAGNPPYAPEATRNNPKYLTPEGAGVRLMMNPRRQRSWQAKTKMKRFFMRSERMAMVTTKIQATA